MEERDYQYKKALVGPMYCDIVWDKIVPMNKRQGEIIEHINKNTGGSYLLYGKVRTGKSHLLIGLFNREIDLGGRKNTTYVVEPEMRKQLTQKLYSPDTECLVDIEQIREWWLKNIFIDDFGKSKASESYEQELYSIIDEIYRQGLRLVISSNYDLSKLSEMYDVGTIRRIEDICEVIKF